MAITVSQSPEQAPDNTRPTITLRSVVLGMATGILLNTYTNYTGMVLINSALVKSQLPISGRLHLVPLSSTLDPRMVKTYG